MDIKAWVVEYGGVIESNAFLWMGDGKWFLEIMGLNWEMGLPVRFGLWVSVGDFPFY